MALKARAEPHESLTFPLKRERVDLYAIRHPYDYVGGNITANAADFSENEFVRSGMVQLRFNEHAWEHRTSCFKKTEECRAFLPTLCQPKAEVKWEEDCDGVECWNSMYYDEYSKQIQTKKRRITAFTVLPQRNFGDQYLNVHSRAISNLFACNSNIQSGEIAHMYYTTVYTSKEIQKEESKNFLFISCQFARTFNFQVEKRLRASNNESASSSSNNESASASSNNESASSSEEAADFVEGLIRVLAGIRAHMASTIVSAPMAHLLATRDSRFHFSHETKGLPVAQVEDLEEGKEISYYYRRRKKSEADTGRDDVNDNSTDENSGDDEEVVVWPDSFADNYMMRPEELRDVSSYEFVMKYEVVYTSAEGDTHSSKRYKGGRLSFEEGHPSKGKAHVRRLKHERVPVIYAKDGLIDMSLLELNDSDAPFQDSPSEAAKIYREQYARLALLLFYPFTDFSQLKTSRAQLYQQRNGAAPSEQGKCLLSFSNFFECLHFSVCKSQSYMSLLYGSLCGNESYVTSLPV